MFILLWLLVKDINIQVYWYNVYCCERFKYHINNNWYIIKPQLKLNLFIVIKCTYFMIEINHFEPSCEFTLIFILYVGLNDFSFVPTLIFSSLREFLLGRVLAMLVRWKSTGSCFDQPLCSYMKLFWDDDVGFKLSLLILSKSGCDYWWFFYMVIGVRIINRLLLLNGVTLVDTDAVLGSLTLSSSSETGLCTSGDCTMVGV